MRTIQLANRLFRTTRWIRNISKTTDNSDSFSRRQLDSHHVIYIYISLFKDRQVACGNWFARHSSTHAVCVKPWCVERISGLTVRVTKPEENNYIDTEYSLYRWCTPHELVRLRRVDSVLLEVTLRAAESWGMIYGQILIYCFQDLCLCLFLSCDMLPWLSWVIFSWLNVST